MKLVISRHFRLHGHRYLWAEWRCASGVLHARWLPGDARAEDYRPVCRGHKRVRD